MLPRRCEAPLSCVRPYPRRRPLGALATVIALPHVANSPPAVFTIGHSTQPFAEFVELLRQCAVDCVVDVRSIPYSRANPHYDRETFASALSAYQIGYVHLGALGGRRGKAADVAPELNAFWHNQSFHNFADYALSTAFRAGLVELEERGRASRCAIMCAEAVWWRCHRRIIADYLIAASLEVFHIMGKGRIVAAQMTPAARRRADGSLSYPAKST
jgi:uncharacterized protein (DUF488 family)